MRTAAEIDSLLQDVQLLLDDQRGRTGIGLHVTHGDTIENSGWISVLVAPDVEGMRGYQFLEAIIYVQKVLKRNGVEKIMILPAGAPDDD